MRLIGGLLSQIQELGHGGIWSQGKGIGIVSLLDGMGSIGY